MRSAWGINRIFLSAGLLVAGLCIVVGLRADDYVDDSYYVPGAETTAEPSQLSPYYPVSRMREIVFVSDSVPQSLPDSVR